MTGHQQPDNRRRGTGIADTDKRVAWTAVLSVLALALVYVILAGVFTHPLFLNAGESTPSGSFSGDQCQTIWFFWWMKTALFELHTSPFWTDAIYYPYGTGLGHHLCPFTNLIAIAAAGILGEPISSPLVYNSLLVLSFALTGLGAFFLIRHFVHDRGAAFVASLFVVFSPARLWHLDHLNLLSIGWGLWAVYFAVRYLKKPRLVSLMIAVVFTVIAFYSDLTCAMLAMLFLVAYVLLSAKAIWNDRDRSRLIGGAVAGMVVAALCILPGLLSLQSDDVEWHVNWQDTEAYSADVLDLVVPWSQAAATGPGEAYAGLLLLIIACGTSVFCRDSVRRPWAIMAAIFLFISLGPTLQIGGHKFLRGLMPERWLFEIVPYLNMSRSPVRFMILAQLCLAVMAAQGVSAWLQSAREWSGRIWSRAIPVITVLAVTLLLVWEYNAGGIGLTSMTVPDVYGEIAADPSIKVICDLPVSDKLQIGNWYMYWQTIHGRKAVNGYLTRPSKSAHTLTDRIKEWRDYGPERMQELRDAGIDAVVYHDPKQESRLIRLNGDGVSGQPLKDE